MRKAHYWVIAATFLFSAQSIGAQEFPSFSGGTYRDLLQAAYAQFERFAGFLATSKIRFLADGGGDGGGSSDGSGSSGDGSGAGDSSSSTGDGDGASDSDSASASDAAATDAADATTTTTTTTDNNDNNVQDPDPDPPNNPTENQDAINTVPTLTINSNVTPLDAIQSIATTDPRGGFFPGDVPPDGLGLALDANVTTIPPRESPPPGAPPENIEIHAVIVSAAQSPWDAIKRAPGVGTVTIVGGIVALGKTPIPGEIPGGGPQSDWLRIIPDLRLLNGSMIPPVVPNIIDIRWMKCPIKVENGDSDDTNKN
jgi:hypothetical protein